VTDRWKYPRLAAVALLVAALSGWAVSAAVAAPAVSVGHDLSYPQCGSGALPAGGEFGIVGLTGGRAFSANPCFAAQYRWASGRPSAPAVYVNTGNPAPASSFYWPASGSRDPALCRDSRSTRDAGCAYDYGWHAASDALALADRTDRSVRTLTWWLDVETANSWNGAGDSTAADLQGAVDLRRSKGIARVGLYSTASQWKAITGGYTAAAANTYRSAWRAAFTPRFPLEQAPLWIATAGDRTAAQAACTTSFTGAAALLAQFADGSGFDADLACRRT
jgi:hypothetical protein